VGDTPLWTPAQYHAYLAGQTRGAPPVPRFLALAPDAPEDALRSRIQALCKMTGHLYYHALKSQGSTPGFPDDVILHPSGGPLSLMELKRDTGAVSPAQQQWLEALGNVTHIHTAVYRPCDWETIYTWLTRRP
jgi:hypothetical protein